MKQLDLQALAQSSFLDGKKGALVHLLVLFGIGKNPKIWEGRPSLFKYYGVPEHRRALALFLKEEFGVSEKELLGDYTKQQPIKKSEIDSDFTFLRACVFWAQVKIAKGEDPTRNDNKGENIGQESTKEVHEANRAEA